MKKLLLILLFSILSSYATDHDDYDLFKRTHSPNHEITKLRLVNHPELKSLKSLQYFPKLIRFSIQDCPNIRDLERSLTSYQSTLKRLTLCRMGITNLSFLAALSCLDSLNLTANDDITSISLLPTFDHLKILHLSGCDAIRDISPLSEMTRLKRLGLSCVLMQSPPRSPPLPRSLHFLEPLAPSLEYLDISCNALL